MSFRALLAKDLRVEWRGRDAFAAALTVAGLVALVGNVAFSELGAPALRVAAVLWTAVAFGAQVGLARSFVIERDQGTYEALLASPASGAAMFWAKLTTNLAVLVVVAFVALLAAALFFAHAPWGALPVLAPLLLLATLGVCLVTTLAAALALHGRNWVLLVPLLALPALFPVLAVAVPGSAIALDGAPLVATLPHLRILVAYDVVMAAASWVLVPYLLEP